MKKYLFSLMAIFIATFGAFASSDYDTVYVEPNKSFDYVLNVDLEEYPYLEDKEITWYAAFNSVNEYTVKSLRADEIQTIGEEKHFHIEKLANDFGLPYQNQRTLTVFYAFKIETKAAIDYDGNRYFTDDYFDEMVCDTVAVLHVLKPLDANEINKFAALNGKFDDKHDLYKYNIGDTAQWKIGFDKNVYDELDIQKYGVVTIQDEDTTVIALSDSNVVSFIPTEDMEIRPLISNDLGYVVKKALKNIVVLPDFEVSQLTTTFVRNNITTSQTEEGTLTMELAPMNGDSIVFVVKTNTKESEIPCQFDWNKDGISLPEGVTSNKDTLFISSFDYETMTGNYNCIITLKDEDKTKINVTLKVDDSIATSNEEIKVSNSQIKVYDNTLRLSNIKGNVNIVTLTGKIVKNIQAKGGEETYILNLPSGVYIVNTENDNIKISI